SIYTITQVDFIALEKVREAYKKAPVFITCNMEVRNELPKDWSQKARLDEYYEWVNKNLGTPPSTNFEFNGLISIWELKDVLKRLLDDQPDIFDKDLATTRSAIRDYIETINNFDTGAGVITITPDNHNGVKWGTALVMGEYGDDEMWHYRPEYKFTQEDFESLPPAK
ncbi:hypothetical protein ACFLWH_02510, partial [Chloroflexota bacterium]